MDERPRARHDPHVAPLEGKRQQIEEASDPMKKQSLIVQCRKEQVALSTMAKNLGDTGKKLDVVIDFLSDLQSHLTQIDGKLDGLQNQVSVMHDDLKRLTGKPVMEFMEEKRQQQLRKANSSLRSKVYIEPGVCGPGPKENFQPGNDNPVEPVSNASMGFLKSNRNVMLLSGQAGSGKSTAMGEMERFVQGRYTEMRKKDAKVDVVLLKVKLPSLRDPLGGVFEEGCKQLNMRQSQADELRELLAGVLPEAEPPRCLLEGLLEVLACELLAEQGKVDKRHAGRLPALRLAQLLRAAEEAEAASRAATGRPVPTAPIPSSNVPAYRSPSDRTHCAGSTRAAQDVADSPSGETPEHLRAFARRPPQKNKRTPLNYLRLTL